MRWPLAASWSSAAASRSWSSCPLAQQPLGDVEAVAAIRDRHRFEEGHAALRQDPVHEGLLLRLDAGSHVGDELPDPMHR